MSRRCATVCLVIAFTACGGDDGPSGGGLDAGLAGGDADLPLPDAPFKRTLALPMIPVTKAVLHGVPLVGSDRDTKIVFAGTSLSMAVGEGYPTELLGTFPDSYFSDCGPLSGSFRFDRLEGTSSTVSATLTELPAIRFTVSEEVDAEFVVFGEYTPGGDEACGAALTSMARVPVELPIKVFARRPTGVRFTRPEPCGEAAPLLLATSSTPELDVQMMTRDLEGFFPANALQHRSVSLTLETNAERDWHLPSAEAGLNELRWPSVATEVTIRPAIGEPISATVVEVSAVRSVAVDFYLGGFAAEPVKVEDGATEGEGGWRRVSNRLLPTVVNSAVGDAVLCSQPDPAWFELTSETPTRCDVRPVMNFPLEAAVLTTFPTLGVSAYVLADGTCTLKLRAPGMNGGKGFERRFSATLLNVSELAKIP
jgi:hypothetical protein